MKGLRAINVCATMLEGEGKERKVDKVREGDEGGGGGGEG